MAVPSTFADLNTTPSANTTLIDGGVATINVIDDHLRAVYAFMASVYSNSGNGWASPYLATSGGTLTGNLGVGMAAVADVSIANSATGGLHLSNATTDTGGYINAPGAQELMVSAGATYSSYSAPNFVMTAKSTNASGVYMQGETILFWINPGVTAGATFNQTERARLESTGNFTVTGSVFELSDARLKTDIEAIPGALAKVGRVRGVTYRRTDGNPLERKTGVLAQELRAVLPEAVKVGADDVLAVNYSAIAGLLIEAVKELNAKVDALRPAAPAVRNPN